MPCGLLVRLVRPLESSKRINGLRVRMSCVRSVQGIGMSLDGTHDFHKKGWRKAVERLGSARLCVAHATMRKSLCLRSNLWRFDLIAFVVDRCKKQRGWRSALLFVTVPQLFGRSHVRWASSICECDAAPSFTALACPCKHHPLAERNRTTNIPIGQGWINHDSQRLSRKPDSSYLRHTIRSPVVCCRPFSDGGEQ